MGASILSVFLLALLLSDSIICGRAPQTEHAENVDPAAASSNHGRTFLNFDSSPAQTHLEFNGGFSSNLHRDDGHGGNSGVFPYPGPGDTGSVLGDYDYATYDQSNYPPVAQGSSYFLRTRRERSATFLVRFGPAATNGDAPTSCSSPNGRQ
ncbi:hypothetical protein MRX96_056396 [Rhipicephalus microplus]